jgi:hypothetical protein
MVLNFGHVHPKSVFGVPQVSGAFYLTGARAIMCLFYAF